MWLELQQGIVVSPQLSHNVLGNFETNLYDSHRVTTVATYFTQGDHVLQTYVVNFTEMARINCRNSCSSIAGSVKTGSEFGWLDVIQFQMENWNSLAAARSTKRSPHTLLWQVLKTVLPRGVVGDSLTVRWCHHFLTEFDDFKQEMQQCTIWFPYDWWKYRVFFCTCCSKEINMQFPPTALSLSSISRLYWAAISIKESKEDHWWWHCYGSSFCYIQGGLQSWIFSSALVFDIILFTSSTTCSRILCPFISKMTFLVINYNTSIQFLSFMDKGFLQ